MPPRAVAWACGALNEKHYDEKQRSNHAACKQQPGNESLVHLFLLWLSFGSPRLLPSVRQGVASLQRNLTGLQWYAGALGAGHPSCGRVLVLERVGRATSPRVEGGLKNTRGTPLRLRALVHSFKLLLRFYEMIFAIGFLLASDGVIEYTRSN